MPEALPLEFLPCDDCTTPVPLTRMRGVRARQVRAQGRPVHVYCTEQHRAAALRTAAIQQSGAPESVPCACGCGASVAIAHDQNRRMAWKNGRRIFYVDNRHRYPGDAAAVGCPA